MVDALKEFRQKLNEVAVFNSNLTYTLLDYLLNTQLLKMKKLISLKDLMK